VTISLIAESVSNIRFSARAGWFRKAADQGEAQGQVMLGLA
jgi:hypothetical protein